eukprot:NODE_216_length_14242_cov_0.417592.p7 type:complete len:259 gc:universal NODE_216_length_14242_cov_0.417592:1555-2331(+)
MISISFYYPLLPPVYSSKSISQMLSMKKLPSKKTIAFFSTALTLLGAIKYDQYKQSQVAKSLAETMSKYANEPLEIDQLPTRICLYILPSFDDTTTFRSEKFVKGFILPILNKSGLDVRIANADSKEELREMISSNFGAQPALAPFYYQWSYARHVGVGSESTRLLAEVQDECKMEFNSKLADYQKEYQVLKSKSWIFTPKYEPPVFIEPKIDELPLNVTKGFKQLHLTTYNLFSRSKEMLKTGSRVVELVKSIHDEF